MKKRILLAFCFVLAAIYLHAQKLESAVYLDSYSAAQITAIAGIPVQYGADLYKVRYFTPDAVGNEHVASGLLCIPQETSLVFPLACYQHGTVGGREDVPSRLAGGFQLPLVLSGLGYIVCAADFVGLGDSPGVHPYVHAATEATAGVDLLLAVKELEEDDDFPEFHSSRQLFIGGYSQGGHASMAAHRLVEAEYSSVFDVGAAAHMSGPYSISEVMVDFTLGDAEYGTVSYLAWLVLGYKTAYPDLLDSIELEDVFKQEYLADIRAFENEEINLWTLNARLSNILIANHGAVRPREMMKEDALNFVLTDPTHPLSQALQDNDTYDWVPQAPTNLYYCVGDEQVSFENAIVAEQVMKDNGSSSVNALRMDSTFPFDHGQCVSPAVTSTVFFFGALADITSSFHHLSFLDEADLYLNGTQLVCDVPIDQQWESSAVVLHSLDGKKVFSADLSLGMSIHEISHLEKGFYIANILNKGHIVKTERLVKM